MPTAPREIGGRTARYLSPMREYAYQATETSIEALRRLRSPWAAASATAHSIVITTADSDTIRLSVEQAEVEPTLEAMRIRADLVDQGQETPDAAAPLAVGDLKHGRNDVVLFTGETWTEALPPEAGDGAAPGASQSMQFSGRAGQRPPSATVVCTTTDAIVVAAATGEGVLVRIGLRPCTLDVERDRVVIARFLVDRGYKAG